MVDEMTRRTFIKSAAAVGAIAGPLGALAAEEQKKRSSSPPSAAPTVTCPVTSISSRRCRA